MHHQRVDLRNPQRQLHRVHDAALEYIVIETANIIFDKQKLLEFYLHSDFNIFPMYGEYGIRIYIV